jgi:multiple sugar transport system permease protein
MTLRRGVFLAGVATLCAWTLVPIYLIALGALGGEAVVNAWPKPAWPASLSAATLQAFLNISGVWWSMLYSVEAACLCMVVSIALGAPAGYALARYRFRGATMFRLFVLLTRAFPVAILALPLTVGFIRLGLYDTPIGVGLMHSVLAMPFAVLISASLFQAIPRELEEAAWVFGCSGPVAFLRVVVPLALPGLAAAAIFAFVISWNEVFAASVLTVRHKTLTAYLLSVLSESPLHVQFAGGFLLILPSVLFIFLVRRQLFSLWGIAGR